MKTKIYLLVISLLLLSTGALAISETDSKLADIQADLKKNQQAYDSLQAKIDVYEENIKSKQQEQTTLKNQLEVIDQDVELTKSEIEQTNIEIKNIGLEIDALQLKITDAEGQIGDNKAYMTKLIRDLYDLDQRTYLEIAFSHNTLSEYSNQVEYTKTVNERFKSIVTQLVELKDRLKQDKQAYNDKKIAEEDKKQELLAREQNLAGESKYKETLLHEVSNDEEKFQQLVKEIKAEQSSYNAEISRLEKSARALYDKLKQSPNTNTPDVLPSDFDPIWPVAGVITTTFKDPGYIYRAYFEHDAIDIAAPQGTALKAADSGVVTIVRFDGSSSYSYVLITHADGFSTLYGHVSAVYVQPEQVVQKGQTIAAVGGMPGTTGAGAYTTGPHVHFGVRLNGIPVDPLVYLP